MVYKLFLTLIAIGSLFFSYCWFLPSPVRNQGAFGVTA